MPADPPLRLGIIGCGRATTAWHLPALRAVEQVSVSAVADLDERRAGAVAAQYGIDRHYGSAEALLSDPNVEAVAVCVPTTAHAGVALAALSSGRHTFIEKPLALSLDECDRILAAARSSGVVTAHGFRLRHQRLVRRARELLSNGRIGEVIALQTASVTPRSMDNPDAKWLRTRALGGGSLIEKGVHHYDLWRYLTGRDVEQVHAASRSSSECDDVTAVVSAGLEGGLLVSTLLTDGSAFANHLSFHGMLGRLELRLERFDGLRVIPISGRSGDLRDRARSLELAASGLGGAVRVARQGGHLEACAEEWRDFVRATRGEGAAAASLEDGRWAVAVALAAAHSSATGEPVRVADAPRSLA